jgi:hypothetical protein
VSKLPLEREYDIPMKSQADLEKKRTQLGQELAKTPREDEMYKMYLLTYDRALEWVLTD